MAKIPGEGQEQQQADGRRGLTLGMSIAGVIVWPPRSGGSPIGPRPIFPARSSPTSATSTSRPPPIHTRPYNSEPPTSGPHLPYIAPWGIHTRPIPNELQVHNLEDGGVMVQYNCECPELVGEAAEHRAQV